jgi:3D (Asp-Asp-Asp) domain-containing protein
MKGKREGKPMWKRWPLFWALCASITVVWFCIGLLIVQVAGSAIRVKATCYDLQGVTASGTHVNRRTAAHNFIPFRTRVRIISRQAGPHGIRKYIIRDTGHALGDGHIDLWSGWGCLRFGVRYVTIKYGWGKP